MDIRTLCNRCADDYTTAGYKLKRTNTQYKDTCDKCGRMGWEYEVMSLDEIRKDRSFLSKR